MLNITIPNIGIIKEQGGGKASSTAKSTANDEIIASALIDLNKRVETLETN